MINKSKEASDAFKAVAVKRIEKMFRGDDAFDRSRTIRKNANASMAAKKTPSAVIRLFAKYEELNARITGIKKMLHGYGYEIDTYNNVIRPDTESQAWKSLYQKERDKNFEAERSLIAEVYACESISEVESVIKMADIASR